MAEASPEDETVAKIIRKSLAQFLFRSIEDDTLNQSIEIFESLRPEKKIKIVNSTMRGCLPLYVAVNLNNVKFSRFLLKISLLQGRDEMSKQWKKRGHPLLAAIKQNNKKLIRLILQHLPDINDVITGPLSPLIVAIFLGNLTAVKLIVSKGADINRPCLGGRTPLMYSTSNSEICNFLLDHGADVNHQDDEGFTAIHLAAGWDHRESVINLIVAGADLSIRNHEGMNPLIWAAINRKVKMFINLGKQSVHSELDKIESCEIYNACTESPKLNFWKLTLKQRLLRNHPKSFQIPTRDILDFSKEFTTESELESLADSPLKLSFQSVLIVERILGTENRVYLKVLLQTALIAKRENNQKKVRQLIKLIIKTRRETAFVSYCVSHFKTLFNEIAESSDPEDFIKYGAFVIFRIITDTLIKMWYLLREHIYMYPSYVDGNYSQIAMTFLYMMAITKKKLPQRHHGTFRKDVKGVLKEDLRLVDFQSLLHRAVVLTSEEPWASLELIDMLLEFGADVCSKDTFEKTPSEYALKYVPENIHDAVFELFEMYETQSENEKSEYFTTLDGTPGGTVCAYEE